MDAICYLCNERTPLIPSNQNFIQLRTVHTKTSFSDLFKRFLGDFQSSRNVDDSTNCICQTCSKHIENYDRACQQASDYEIKLRALLLSTETKLCENDDQIDHDNEQMDGDFHGVQSFDNGSNGDDSSNNATEEIQIKEKCDESLCTESVKPNHKVNPTILLKFRPVKTGKELIVRVTATDLYNGKTIKTDDGKSWQFKASRPPMSSAQPLGAPDKIFVKLVDPASMELTTSQTTQFECDICDRKFGSKYRIICHMEQHKLNPGFKCEYCLFHFDTNNKDAYKAHVALHKVKPSNICVFCNKLLSDVRALKRHTKTHGNWKFACDMCDRKFYARVKLNDHKKIHTQNWTACRICGLKIIQKRKMQNHMKWHKTHRELLCQMCSFQSSDEQSYKQHMELHNNSNNRFACVLCEKVTENRYKLGLHVRYKHNEPTVLCEVCGSKFPTVTEMLYHKPVHSDETPYACDQCPKAFKWKNSLITHRQTHLSVRDRPFACAFCGMRFLRVDHCQVHERRHREDTKTEKCQFCSATFEHKFYLKQHTKRKHGAEMPTGSTMQINPDE